MQLVATTAVELALEPLADSFGNECLGDSRTFESVSGQLALSGDDAYQAVSLPFSFQAVFHEAGEITIAWDGIDANPTEQGATAVVGIANSGGTEALAYSQFQPVLASGDGVAFQPGAEIGTSGTLTGVVTCSGAAAEGVIVAVAGKSAVTAADGSWQLSDIAIGAYTLVATASAGACVGSTLVEADVSVEVTVVGGATKTLDVTMAADTSYVVTAGTREFLPAPDALALTGDDSVISVSLPFTAFHYGKEYNITASFRWCYTRTVTSRSPGAAWRMITQRKVVVRLSASRTPAVQRLWGTRSSRQCFVPARAFCSPPPTHQSSQAQWPGKSPATGRSFPTRRFKLTDSLSCPQATVHICIQTFRRASTTSQPSLRRTVLFAPQPARTSPPFTLLLARQRR